MCWIISCSGALTSWSLHWLPGNLPVTTNSRKSLLLSRNKSHAHLYGMGKNIQLAQTRSMVSWGVNDPSKYRAYILWESGHTGRLTLNELCTNVSSKSMTTQIFPASFDLICGSSGLAGTWGQRRSEDLRLSSKLTHIQTELIIVFVFVFVFVWVFLVTQGWTVWRCLGLKKSLRRRSCCHADGACKYHHTLLVCQRAVRDRCLLMWFRC